KGGKIAEVYDGTFPDAKTLNAEPIDGAGKTILPGLIDMHVHIGGPGGFYEDWTKFDPAKANERALEAYLYCGVTAVRSVGDKVDDMIKLRNRFNSGERLGTELFLCGPLSPPKAATGRNTRSRCRRLRALISTRSSSASRNRKRRGANKSMSWRPKG
ncbi:MAG: hypothetical protein ABIU29_08435, partial [Chthoniobacterales bacterium]